jgi:GLPGLI family protein
MPFGYELYLNLITVKLIFMRASFSNRILFVLIFSVGININSYAQINQGKIIYKVDMQKFINEIESETLDDVEIQHYDKISQILKDVEFELLFKDNLAVFDKREGLSLGEGQFFRKMALLYCSTGRYLTNSEEKKQILTTNVDGVERQVEKPIDKENNWELTNEKKTIADFVCYKAVKIVDVPKGKKQIVAWYTPEIPIRLGPKEYVGQLPGLILEIDDLLVSFKCSKITLNHGKKIDIEWPKDIETMTEEEYKKEGDKVKEQLGKRW